MLHSKCQFSHLALTTVSAFRADRSRLRGRIVVHPLGLTRMTVLGTAAVEPESFPQWNRLERLNVVKLSGVWFLLEKAKCLVTDSHPLAPIVDVVVVVFHLLERTPVDNRLVPFQARPLLSFARDDRQRARS